ncbi:threonine aldolase family protein, partial [Tessaracoccus lubricantis]
MTDLRSDTVTRPSADMLAAMAGARVGDDVYGEDPTVALLEQRVAELFGKEDALFCATGSLANQLGVWLHTPPGTEVLCDAQAHIARAEMGGHAANAGVTMRTWQSVRGRLVADDALALVAVDCGPYLVETACLEVEDTHNFGGGTVQDFDELRKLSEGARALGVATHLDGARLANAAAVTGRSFDEYGALFDTVSLCLSKGLGAPVGSVLVGTAEQMARARVQRKRLGAGWRQ